MAIDILTVVTGTEIYIVGGYNAQHATDIELIQAHSTDEGYSLNKFSSLDEALRYYNNTSVTYRGVRKVHT